MGKLHARIVTLLNVPTLRANELRVIYASRKSFCQDTMIVMSRVLKHLRIPRVGILSGGSIKTPTSTMELTSGSMALSSGM
jgi:hypothetical protein